MTLRVVGSGIGRTGTMSLQAALQTLLDGRCYHMIEVISNPDHVPMWHAAARDDPVDWHELMEHYVAAVDWPAGAFWQELAQAFPDAVILHSERESADAWWTSASRTIFTGMDGGPPPGMEAWHAMLIDLMANRFTADFTDERAAKAAYERHNAHVREHAPADRLVVWKPGDGWEPICEALGLPVPDQEFPHTNTTAEFRATFGFDPV